MIGLPVQEECHDYEMAVYCACETPPTEPTMAPPTGTVPLPFTTQAPKLTPDDCVEWGTWINE